MNDDDFVDFGEPNPYYLPRTRTDFITEVLALFQYNTEFLHWRVDQDGAVRFWADCSDVFHWASADMEEITEERMSVLRQAFADCPDWPGYLYAARVLGMRPQGAMYKYLKGYEELFDACGPEREVGLGNPVDRNHAHSWASLDATGAVRCIVCEAISPQGPV